MMLLRRSFDVGSAGRHRNLRCDLFLALEFFPPSSMSPRLVMIGLSVLRSPSPLCRLALPPAGYFGSATSQNFFC